MCFFWKKKISWKFFFFVLPFSIVLLSWSYTDLGISIFGQKVTSATRCWSIGDSSIHIRGSQRDSVRTRRSKDAPHGTYAMASSGKVHIEKKQEASRRRKQKATRKEVASEWKEKQENTKKNLMRWRHSWVIRKERGRNWWRHQLLTSHSTVAFVSVCLILRMGKFEETSLIALAVSIARETFAFGSEQLFLHRGKKF